MSVNFSSHSSLHPELEGCLSRMSVTASTAPFISYILLLPLFITVLYVGYQRRRRKQHGVAKTAMTSDILTYNMVVLELISVLGSLIYCYGSYTYQKQLQTVSMYIYYIVLPGQTLFHLLTCVERYLAVARPITYRGLRQARGVRIRNISIWSVWLICFGAPCLLKIDIFHYIILNFVIVALSLIVISFCSLSVLSILIRPGPGDVGVNRERVDQTKRRVFYIVTATLAALMLRFSIILVFFALSFSPALQNNADVCLSGLFMSWLSQPSSLVLPLLFLHRAGKLPGCNHNTEQHK